MLRFFAGLAAVAVALAAECPTDFSATFADMHDGDQKTVAISGAAMTITPANNNETWVIAAELDPVWCNATIDFNVPGKPSPPLHRPPSHRPVSPFDLFPPATSARGGGGTPVDGSFGPVVRFDHFPFFLVCEG